MGDVGDVGTDPALLPSRARMLPTYSDDNRNEPVVSIFFTGRIVSTPVPKSASRTTVPFEAVRAAYDDRLGVVGVRTYAGGAPRSGLALASVGLGGPVSDRAASSFGTTCPSGDANWDRTTTVACCAEISDPIPPGLSGISLPFVAASVFTESPSSAVPNKETASSSSSGIKPGCTRSFAMLRKDPMAAVDLMVSKFHSLFRVPLSHDAMLVRVGG